MALTGLDIFKLLPKTNCGDCGVPTCLAFAMKLAAGQAELSVCPHVSEDAKEKLSDAAAPPIRGVTLGSSDYAFKIGEETVLFRHDKTFVNPPGFGVYIEDSLTDSEIEVKVEQANKLSFERVGQVLRANIIAVKSTSTSQRFSEVVKAIASKTSLPFILMADSSEIIKEALPLVAERKPLIYAATKDNYEAMATLAKEFNCPLAVYEPAGLDALADLTEKVSALGIKDIVLDPRGASSSETLKKLVFIRRAALKKKFRSLGYPIVTFPFREAEDDLTEAALGAVHLVKYAGIIVFKSLEAWKMLPLLVLRQNIYTDPQRPMRVEEGIYEIGSPNENSPLLITTNFSLTYFIVSSEIEGSKVPAWLAIMDVEGLSVLTAWAAGKFVPEQIAAFIKKSGAKDKVKHSKLIIPGYVAQISGELEEELPEWKIEIGPREANDLPLYLKSWSA